jgi:hypothetical protein
MPLNGMEGWKDVRSGTLWGRRPIKQSCTTGKERRIARREHTVVCMSFSPKPTHELVNVFPDTRHRTGDSRWRVITTPHSHRVSVGSR